MKPKYYWIKRRDNPQIGSYYSLLGNVSQVEALRWMKTRYGSNTLFKYETKDEYEKAINHIVSSGERILR